MFKSTTISLKYDCLTVSMVACFGYGVISLMSSCWRDTHARLNKLLYSLTAVIALRLYFIAYTNCSMQPTHWQLRDIEVCVCDIRCQTIQNVKVGH